MLENKDSQEEINKENVLDPIKAERIKELVKYSDDKNWKVRALISDHQDTPLEILIKLSKDERGQVRDGIAKNKNTPPEILLQLCEDDNKYIRNSALNNLASRFKKD